MKSLARDYQLERMVHAQSATIDMIMKGSSDDIARLIIYLQRRIELEEGYQNSLAQIVHHLEESDVSNPLYQSAVNTHIQRTISDYLNMGHSIRPTRNQFIHTMKTQLQSLIKLKEQQDRSRRSHRKNMHQVNNLYLATRIEELPEARDTYLVKWEEIDRTQVPAMPNSPLNPSTPTATAIQHTVSPRSYFFPKSTTLPKPGITNSNHSDDLSETSSLSSMTSSTISPRSLYSDDDQRNSPPINTATAPMSSISLIVTQSKLDSIPPPSSPQKRIHQFMKSFQSNHVQDTAKQTVRLAKLKVEMNEADLNYRRVVRKLDTLTKKQRAANEFAIKSLQNQLLEKSTLVKQVLEHVLMAEMNHTHEENGIVQSMHHSLLNLHPEVDQNVFNNLLSVDKYPMPSPVYYINHHVGECKDLLFGTTLMEYYQLKSRSPPLIITRCIQAVERLGGLEKEGIYRVSGKQTTIEKIKQAFERDEETAIFGQNDLPEEVYCIASVIKIFLRELAAPLFPFSLADRVTYSQIPDKELRLMNLLTRILKLPGPNYDTLKVLVEHLSKLELLVEKNKMTVSNLSLLFTPAIFQDHNQAQVSPGEWKKDCVLDDLLENVETLFADKDLRGASAITGVIDYGFEKSSLGDSSLDADSIFENDDDDITEEKDEYHLPTPYSPPAYSTKYVTLATPTNPTSPECYQLNENPTDLGPVTASPTSPSATPRTNDIIIEPSNSTLAPGKEKRNSKFRTVSQDRGLTVNTHPSSIKTSVVGTDTKTIAPPTSNNIANAISPSVQSATIPSFDWLNKDPETPNPIATSSSLRRSVTTGRTPPSKRKQNTIPRMPTKNASTTTSINRSQTSL